MLHFLGSIVVGALTVVGAVGALLFGLAVLRALFGGYVDPEPPEPGERDALVPYPIPGTIDAERMRERLRPDPEEVPKGWRRQTREDLAVRRETGRSPLDVEIESREDPFW